MSLKTVIGGQGQRQELNPDSESDPENIENRQIIDTDPTAIVMTTTIQLEELVDPEEGERLFHSHIVIAQFVV
jgi:hypothetical protein